VVGIIAFALRWAMAALAVPEPFVTVIWVVFALIVLLAILGLLGYGPMKGSWHS
jgi:hypothetical protein